ncbi:hypothetical protein AURDEDRAFT_165519 [Auricularia subglabra TFB-10046 SS5]|nr:hypothetical protein AURDEDRAFT_165519 [Auricularia subglabra TFB-10046 SS5]
MPSADKEELRCYWYLCSISEPFDDHKGLYEHLKAYHTVRGGRLTDRCKWRGCTRGYGRDKDISARMRHLITHTSYRPFICECGTTFNRKDNLKHHLSRYGHEELARDNEDNEKASADDEDNEEASADDEEMHHEIGKELILAEQDRSAAVWQICDRTFTRPSGLKAHMKISHEGPSPHHRIKRGTAQTTKFTLKVEDWSDDDEFAAQRNGSRMPPAPDGPETSDPTISNQNLQLLARISDLEKQHKILDARQTRLEAILDENLSKNDDIHDNVFALRTTT